MNYLEQILSSNVEELGSVIWYLILLNNQEIICKALQGASEQQVQRVCNSVSKRMSRCIMDNISLYQNASVEEVIEARRALLHEITGRQCELICFG